MGDSTVFGFGVFVVLLFLSGIVFTIREFQNMDEKKQRNWKKQDMNIKKKDSK
jgi:hypothetical protein